MEQKTLKQLVKLTILIIVISYVVDKVLFFSLNTISDNVMSGQVIGKLNQFLMLKDSTDLLVFGNSRANHHIIADQFNDNAFNMGVNGVGIAYSSTLVNSLPKDKEQIIIVHIDTKNFFNDDYDGSDIGGLRSKYNRNEEITEALDASGRVSFLQNIYYSINYNGSLIGILKNYIKPKYDYKTYKGYDPLVVNESQSAARDYRLRNNIAENCTDSHKVNQVALNYLMKIKAVKEKSKKNFIFVTSPIHNDACDEDNKILNGIMTEHKLSYRDYSNLYKTTQPDDMSLWRDQKHLSNLGAEKFTKYLREEFLFLR